MADTTHYTFTLKLTGKEYRLLLKGLDAISDAKVAVVVTAKDRLAATHLGQSLRDQLRGGKG